MKFIELYVKESYRLSNNPFSEKATGAVVWSFLIIASVSFAVKFFLGILATAR